MKKLWLCFLLFSCVERPEKPKNLILVIADGMGPQQLSLLQLFEKYSRYGSGSFVFDEMGKRGRVGLSMTDPSNMLTTDSACSANQLATGKPSLPGVLGLDDKGNSVPTILEMAQEKGIKTGLVTDTQIVHATPAAFASHVRSRRMAFEIASQMLETAPDVMLGGGATYFLPQGTKSPFISTRPDSRDLVQEAQAKNYKVIYSKKDFKKAHKEKVLGLFAEEALPDGAWYSQNKKHPDIPTLKEMSQFAVSKLSKNQKGFFLMIEAGQIDWAGHKNDAGNLLHHMLDFHEMVKWLFDYVKKHEETLLIVTADHETGSFGISYDYEDDVFVRQLPGEKFQGKDYKLKYDYGDKKHLDQLFEQTLSFESMFEKFDETQKRPEDLVRIVNQHSAFKITKSQAQRILEKHPIKKGGKMKKFPAIREFTNFYGSRSNARQALLGRVLAPQQNVVWGTGGHTATPVPIFAFGPGSEHFGGFHHHTDLGQKMIQLFIK